MITIFTTYKELGWRQLNAINSWRWFNADVLFVDEDTETPRNEYGTPYLGPLFRKAIAYSIFDVLAYVNSDIILLDDFIPAVKAVAERFEDFLMVGRRVNWHCPVPLEWVTPSFPIDWRKTFREKVLSDSRLFNAATDYFVFTKPVFDIEMPPLAIGRYYWDVWLYWSAMDRGYPVIDATEAVLAVHQNHLPSHRSWESECEFNKALLPDEVFETGFDLDHVPRILTKELEIKRR